MMHASEMDFLCTQHGYLSGLQQGILNTFCLQTSIDTCLSGENRGSTVRGKLMNTNTHTSLSVWTWGGSQSDSHRAAQVAQREKHLLSKLEELSLNAQQQHKARHRLLGHTSTTRR